MTPARGRMQRLGQRSAHLVLFLGVSLGLSSALSAESTSPFGDRTIDIYDSSGATQDYRIVVFDTGVGHYEGKARVKTIGPRGRKIDPKDVEALADALEQAKVFDAQPYLVPRSERASHPNITVGLYRNGQTRALIHQEMGNPELNEQVYKIFERFFPTQHLRCPFVVESSPAFPRGGDLCSVHSPVRHLMKEKP